MKIHHWRREMFCFFLIVFLRRLFADCTMVHHHYTPKSFGEICWELVPSIWCKSKFCLALCRSRQKSDIQRFFWNWKPQKQFSLNVFLNMCSFICSTCFFQIRLNSIEITCQKQSHNVSARLWNTICSPFIQTNCRHAGVPSYTWEKEGCAVTFHFESSISTGSFPFWHPAKSTGNKWFWFLMQDTSRCNA